MLTPPRRAKKLARRLEKLVRLTIERREELTRKNNQSLVGNGEVSDKLVSIPTCKKLLKGVRFGDFYSAKNGNLILGGATFSLRIGYFFHIWSCAIIHNRQYIVLRRISTSHYNKNMITEMKDLLRGELTYHQSAFVPDKNLRGKWWSSGPIGVDYKAVWFGIHHSEFVLLRSKFDLLKRGE